MHTAHVTATRKPKPNRLPHPLSAHGPAAGGPSLLQLLAGPEDSCCTAAAFALTRSNVELPG